LNIFYISRGCLGYSLSVVFVALFILGLLGASFGGYYYSSAMIGLGFIYGIILLVFMIPSVLVMRRAESIYHAAKRNDVNGLKDADSVGWAVVALIFTGVIPGILLLVAHGSIPELEATAVGGRPTLGSCYGQTRTA
jgi:putative membrane protein